MTWITKHWKAISAFIMLLALLYFMIFHWGRFLADFWPFDASRVGPNLVASVVQYALLAILFVLLYPPARRAVERFALRHAKDIKDHVSAEHKRLHDKLAHHEVMAKHNADLLNHIIKHSPDIPDFPHPLEQATPQGAK